MYPPVKLHRQLMQLQVLLLQLMLLKLQLLQLHLQLLKLMILKLHQLPAPDTEGAMDPASRAWTWSRISTLLKSFVAASPAEPKAAPSSHGLTEDQATGIPVRIIHEDYIVYMKDSRKRTVPITRITTIPRIK